MHEPLSLLMSLRQLSSVKVGRDQKQYATRHVAVHVVGAPSPFDSGCIIFAQKAPDCHVIHEPIVRWKTGICFERALAAPCPASARGARGSWRRGVPRSELVVGVQRRTAASVPRSGASGAAAHVYKQERAIIRQTWLRVCRLASLDEVTRFLGNWSAKTAAGVQSSAFQEFFQARIKVFPPGGCIGGGKIERDCRGRTDDGVLRPISRRMRSSHLILLRGFRLRFRAASAA